MQPTHAAPPVLSVAELAWAAGMFEGEGSIRISTHTHTNKGLLVCDMVNVQPEVTAFFHERWGGYHRGVRVPAPRRSYWRWRIAARQVLPFLEGIRPHLRTAHYKEKADLALEYQGQKTSRRSINRTPEYAAAQVRYYERMRDLNVRGCTEDQDPLVIA
jgi:hypothetical protein